MSHWITNNPEAARRLREIDAAYECSRMAARDLPLSQKAEAYRVAKGLRAAAYDALIERIEPMADSTSIIVRDEHGAELCRCTLAEFIQANDFDDGEIGALRTRIAKGEEWSCGGGAAAFFTVSRAD